MQIPELLLTLKMRGAFEALESFSGIQDKEEYARAILGSEHEYREQNMTKRRLSTARFPTEKEWDDFDPALNPTIDISQVKSLSNGKFVDKKENLCILGTQGTGKTHSLIALGRLLCRKGYSTRFYTACSLVNLLEEAKAQNQLSRVMAQLLIPKLIIIDELGFIPFSDNGARLLFDVFASRYERGSIAVTSNLAFTKWGQIFGSVELTAALVDRFTHRAHIFTYEGQSVRLKQAKQKQPTSRLKAPEENIAVVSV